MDSETRTYGCEGDNLPSATIQSGSKTEYYTQTQKSARLLKSTTRWNGTGWVNPVTYDYDIYGNAISLTDPNSNVTTTTTYDTTYHALPVTISKSDNYSGTAIPFITENFYDSRLRVEKVRNHDV